MRLLFVYYHKYPQFWKDGLWRALIELDRYYEIDRVNLLCSKPEGEYDFALGWGAYKSPADNFLKSYTGKKGLCFGGSTLTGEFNDYNVFFYENPLHANQHHHGVHAFGVNTEIFHPTSSTKFIDVLGVGALAYWKRWKEMINKKGVRMVVGEYQKDNPYESDDIVNQLIRNGVGYMGLVDTWTLSTLYNASKSVFMPADEMGGGGRVLLEARASDVPVEIMPDNRLLTSYLKCPVWDFLYYARQLKKGIDSCL